MRWLWELQLGRVLSAMASANDIGNDGQPEQAILVVRLGEYGLPLVMLLI